MSAHDDTTSDEATSHGVVATTLLNALEKAAEHARPLAVAHVRAQIKRRPDATPAELIRALERQLTATVAGSGAAAGGAAAAPAVTTPLGLALGVTDATAFTGAVAMYVFALAEVYDIPTDDVVRRRTLLLGVFLGDSGQAVLSKVAERTGKHWAKAIVKSVPVDALRKVNAVLGRNFVTKYGTKQGILVLGKAVPFGMGAVIGATGNALFARMAIHSARRAFGPPPETLPAWLHDEARPSS